jgi:hypothetical protein
MAKIPTIAEERKPVASAAAEIEGPAAWRRSRSALAPAPRISGSASRKEKRAERSG